MLGVGIDAALVLVLTGLLAPSTGLWCAERAVLALRIGEAGSPWTGVAPMLLGMAGEITYGWPVAVVILITVPLAFFGVSPGRLLTGAKAWPRRWLPSLLATLPSLLLLVVWIAGSWVVFLLSVGITAIWIVANMFCLVSSRQTLASRFAGMRVSLEQC